MLPLMRAAERAGNEVRVATGPDLLGPLSSRGLDVHAVGPTWAESWSAHEAVWSDPDLPDEQKMMDGVVALFGTPALGAAHRPARDDAGLAPRRRRPRGPRDGGVLARPEAWRAGGRARPRTHVPVLCPAHRPRGRRDRRARAVGSGLVRAGPGHLPALAAARRRPTAVAGGDASAAERRRAWPGPTRRGRGSRSRRPRRLLHPRHGQERRRRRLQGRAHRPCRSTTAW